MKKEGKRTCGIARWGLEREDLACKILGLQLGDLRTTRSGLNDSHALAQLSQYSVQGQTQEVFEVKHWKSWC